MPITQRGNRFEASVTYQGKRYRKMFPSIAEAQEWETTARQCLILGKPVPDVKGSGVSSYTFGQAADHTFALHWQGKASEDKMIYMVRILKDFFGANRPITDFDKDLVDSFVFHLMDERKADGTINRHLSAVSKILREAVDRNKLSKMPKISKRKEKTQRVRWLTLEEEKAILDQLELWGDDDLRDAMIVSVDTGCRASELLKITARDVMKEGVYLVGRKANNNSVIPLTKRARAILEARAVKNPSQLFPFKRHWYRQRWDKVLDHLGIRDVVWHTLRHTTCSRLVQGGMPLKHVQEWMGHKAIVTTMRYAHLSPKSLSSGVNILEPA